MQRVPKSLVPPTQITASAATYYTAPANTVAEITAATATNSTGTARTITVHIVASGGSAAAANKVVQTKVVPANGAVLLPELVGQKIPTGSFISALADAATAVNLTVGGYEVS